MEIPEAADLPSVYQICGPPMGPRRFWYFVRDARREEMPRVVIAIAIVRFYAGAVCDYGPILADLIEGVRPSIAYGSTQSMPDAKPVNGLKRVVVGCANAVLLKNNAGVGILQGKLTLVIDV